MRRIKVFRQPQLDARYAWLGLGIYVLITDPILIRLIGKSMSKQFYEWPRTVTIPVSAYLLAHLFQWPTVLTRYDPLNRLGIWLAGKNQFVLVVEED